MHVAEAVNEIGRALGTASSATTAAGNRELLSWLRGLGELDRIGIEGTASWGAGLCRYLAAGVIKARLRPFVPM